MKRERKPLDHKKGRVMILEKRPELIEEWDWENNSHLDINTISHGSHKVVAWKCKKGHKWTSKVTRRGSNGENCPYCMGKKRVCEETSLEFKFPEIAKEWSYGLNEKTPKDFFGGSAVKVWWECSKCKSEYPATIGSRTSSGNGCPYCNYHKININSCLLTTHPELCKEWDYNENKDVEPTNVKARNNKRVSWICKDGHKWKAKINRRAKMGAGCPFCQLLDPPIENSLATKSPEISNEWDYELNDYTPSNFKNHSHKKVWWKCPKCYNSYKSIIKDRTLNGNGCSYCAGKMVDENTCLINNFPELCEEWDYAKNVINPKNISVGSGKKVWWKCKKCQYSWHSTIYHRTKTDSPTGCPKCKSSIGEIKVKEILDKYNLQYIREYKFNECKNIKKLSFDLYIYGKNNQVLFCIEYNGRQHYESIEYMGGAEGLEKIKRRDTIKIKFCKKEKIPLLIIPYWDINKIEELMIDFINNLDHYI